MPCDNGHTGNEVSILKDLPASQSGDGRHRCAVCAYEAGEDRAIERINRLREQVRQLGAEPIE